MNHLALLPPLANIVEPWMIGIIVPVVSLVFAGVMAVSAMYFKHQKQLAWHQTARLALEKGQPMPPPPMSDEELKYAPAPPTMSAAEWQQAQRTQQRRRDLRAGLILLAVGGGLYLMLREMSGTDVAMVGAIPGLIGVALLLHGLLDRVLTGNK
jgi:hypothetical protein